MPAPRQPRSRERWIAVLAAVAGAALIVRVDIATRRADFQAEARTAHRILSQATARLDAVLGTLVLVAGPEARGGEADATARLPALHPQVMAAWRRAAAQPWPATRGGEPVPAAALTAAEARSGAAPQGRREAALATVDTDRATYTLVLAGSPASFALRVDARRLAPAEEWPWPADAPVHVTLAHGGDVIVLHDAAASPSRPFGLTAGFAFSKTLASPSQPFVMQAQRFAGPAQWPWALVAAWVALCTAAYGAARRWQAARAERRRAEALARLAHTARLNTMGELAAGLAHELNQPLTATLAGTQAALRLLREAVPADAADAAENTRRAVQALELAGGQARRAADVVARLRHLLQPGGTPARPVATDVAAIARRLAALLAPELEQRAIEIHIEGQAPPARADPVAVEQVLHNLLTNAMHALEAGAAPQRRIVVRLAREGGRVRCAVRDNGPGVAPQA
ncbi:MAG: two-component sensor histidine kinase, partial [Betaproteobacteria bacterium]|nr:two-component sensor histidine kinase [Betaproteobacteria bacterium]